MSAPERFSFGEPGPPAPRPSYCGGAILRVSLDEYRQMERNGVTWATRSEVFKDSLDGGKALARVHCTGEAVDGFALCSSCSGHEANFRALLRDRARVAGGQR